MKLIDIDHNPEISTLGPLADGSVPHDWFERFGAGPVATPRFETIIAGFEHHARQQPEAIAVKAAGETITYGDLDMAANRVAAELRQRGVGHGDAVGLYIVRSIEMVVGIIAAMKVGAAYVPQHLGVAPETALRHIGKTTGAETIMTCAALADQVPLNEGQSLLLIDDVMKDTTIDATPVASPSTAEDRCMVLFTSGTTGVPNGVQVTHRNLVNILLTAPGDLGSLRR